MTDIPSYPRPKAQPEKVDPVARSLAKPDACAKPCTMGSRGVRIRPMSEKQRQKVTLKKRKRKHDPRDVHFF